MFEENPACLGTADKCGEAGTCQNKPAALTMEGFSTALQQIMQTVLERVWKRTEEGEDPVEGRHVYLLNTSPSNRLLWRWLSKLKHFVYISGPL